MKETLNQDTEPHESCRRLGWRRGMGPSVAAYEWLTDSQCCWHKLKKCEEVVKISAAAHRIARKLAAVRNEQTQTRRVLHSSLLTFHRIARRRSFFSAFKKEVNSHYNTSVTLEFMPHEFFGTLSQLFPPFKAVWVCCVSSYGFIKNPQRDPEGLSTHSLETFEWNVALDCSVRYARIYDILFQYLSILIINWLF